MAYNGETLFGGYYWNIDTYTATDADYGIYTESYSKMRKGPIGLWVVQYRACPGYYVVNGAEGRCGEEPVVAGPYETLDDARHALIMLDSMGVC